MHIFLYMSLTFIGNWLEKVIYLGDKQIYKFYIAIVQEFSLNLVLNLI